MRIEFAPFRLAADVSETVLLDAATRIQREFLGRQPGCIKRYLLRGGDGCWADLVHWESEAAMHAAMQQVEQSAACQRYFSLMSPATLPAEPVHSFDVVQEY